MGAKRYLTAGLVALVLAAAPAVTAEAEPQVAAAASFAVATADSMDLSYPKDELIEADRKELLRALQAAAKKKLGVVAFYH